MMAGTLKHTDTNQETESGIHPKKFVLWLLIVASGMLFAAFTSAYIVRRGEGNWLVFDLPTAFTINIFIALLGSVFMQLAYRAAKHDELEKLKVYLLITLVVGIAFMTGQWLGWKQLVSNQIFLAGNPAESFIYVISGMHFLHMVMGVGFLMAVIVKAFRFNVHRKNMLSIYMCTTFWHFLGAMWIYLYIFFSLNR